MIENGKIRIFPAQMDTQSMGRLQVNVVTEAGDRPIENARIRIAYNDNPETVVEEITTDISGRSPVVELPAPPIEYSLEPVAERPYSEFTVNVEAEGFETTEINGTAILPEVTAIQPIRMLPQANVTTEEVFVILPHTLYYEYPPKIAEDEIKPITSDEIVLSQVVIPEFVVVHDGPPTDASAQNHYVRYRDYIKNVASSEIYATWPEAAIYANILAIMSFTLNRVYTEWYRNRGYNFTITSSTAFDQKWMPGRNIYDSINVAVDNIFNNFLSRPNVRQPILTQYCDGRRVTCPRWLSQWGSKTLADQGRTTIEIIRHYYGSDMYINSANEVAGVPSSWPGSDLTIGSMGDSVRQMQEQLNAIGSVYTLIPALVADGVYGSQTFNAVRIFQEIFGLPPTGIVDFPTWYKISEIYVAVTRIAEFM